MEDKVAEYHMKRNELMNGGGHMMDFIGLDRMYASALAKDITEKLERFIEQDDSFSAWNLQSEFTQILSKQAPGSPEHTAMTALWNKMLMKWR